ncbi:MAG: hypothetical protein AB7F59_08490 [Bdellovibrionales bacterium]
MKLHIIAFLTLILSYSPSFATNDPITIQDLGAKYIQEVDIRTTDWATGRAEFAKPILSNSTLVKRHSYTALYNKYLAKKIKSGELNSRFNSLAEQLSLCTNGEHSCKELDPLLTEGIGLILIFKQEDKLLVGVTDSHQKVQALERMLRNVITNYRFNSKFWPALLLISYETTNDPFDVVLLAEFFKVRAKQLEPARDIADTTKRDIQSINQFQLLMIAFQNTISDPKIKARDGLNYANRIEEIRLHIASLVPSKYDLLEYYESIGVLREFYIEFAKFKDADRLTIERGWLRVNYPTLTDSFPERAVLFFWGILTDFGTSIHSLIWAGIFMLVLSILACLSSPQWYFSTNIKSDNIFVKLLDSLVSLFTLRGEESLRPSYKIALETLVFSYVSVALAFFITFVLRWS